MSGRIQISQIPVKSRQSLSRNESDLLIVAKNLIKASGAKAGREFRNEKNVEKPVDPKNQNSAQVEAGIAPTKEIVKRSRLPEPLPKPQDGYAYREFDAGLVEWNGVKWRGKWRFVIEVHLSRNTFGNIYYTEEHYQKFTFFRIV